MFNFKYKKFQEYILNSFLLVVTILLVNLFIKNETINKIKNMYNLDKDEIKIDNKEASSKDEVLENDQVIQEEKVIPNAEEISKYLGGLRCDGCNKRCLLTRPQCIIGERKAEVETTKYIQNYVNN
jgi:predicted Holliday junction resolvase-like endonuclease